MKKLIGKSYNRIQIILGFSILFVFTYGCKEISRNSFLPGNKWTDTDSVHINAHGGGIMLHEGVYYWFGEHKTEGSGGNKAKFGISCYSSTDLYNWKNEGIALSTVKDTSSDITVGSIMERPKVIHNKKTDKFIMWFHLELKSQGYSAARTALAISDNPTGPYIYVKSLRPNAGHWPVNMPVEFQEKEYNETIKSWTDEWKQAVKEGMLVKRDFEGGQMSRDMSLFVDDDGIAYHIHSAEDNLTLHISELTDDYQDFTGKYTRIMPGGHNEAPAIFKRKNKYYLITSGCTGWDPNAARSFVAENILGPWESLGNPCKGEDAELTFNSQSTFVLPVNEKLNQFIFMADRWMPKNPIDGRYIWLPIKFEDEKPIIEWHDEWSLSVFN